MKLDVCDMLVVVGVRCYRVGDYVATGGCVKVKRVPGLVMLHL